MAIIVPLGTYPAGTRNFGPLAIQQGAVRAVCSIDIQDMTTPDKSFDYETEISYDDGANWVTLTGARFTGQVVKAGVTKQTNSVGLSQPENANRRIRGFITTVGTITTSVDVTFS